MYRAVAADRWCRLADSGCIYVPWDLTGDAEDAMLYALRLAVVRQPNALRLYIDTVNGTNSVWEMAQLIERATDHSHAHVTGHALSAGLILTVACKRRTCVPSAEFLYHGADKRNHDADDARRAEWFARRTTAPYEFWLSKTCDGEYRFGAREALELGVVHEVTA